MVYSLTFVSTNALSARFSCFTLLLSHSPLVQQPKTVSIDVIIEACVRTQLFKYEDVTVKIVGRRAGRVLEMSLLIFCFGVSVFCVILNKFAFREVVVMHVDNSHVLLFISIIIDSSCLHCSSWRYSRSGSTINTIFVGIRWIYINVYQRTNNDFVLGNGDVSSFIATKCRIS